MKGVGTTLLFLQTVQLFDKCFPPYLLIFSLAQKNCVRVGQKSNASEGKVIFLSNAISLFYFLPNCLKKHLKFSTRFGDVESEIKGADQTLWKEFRTMSKRDTLNRRKGQTIVNTGITKQKRSYLSLQKKRLSSMFYIYIYSPTKLNE